MKPKPDPVQDWTRAVLSVVIILMVASVLYALFYREIPLSNRDAVMLVLGALLLRLSDVYAYNFNSNAASGRKDATISAQAHTISSSQSALPPASLGGNEAPASRESIEDRL